MPLFASVGGRSRLVMYTAVFVVDDCCRCCSLLLVGVVACCV